MNTSSPIQVRHLLIVLGDQLNVDSAGFDGWDPDRDLVWMAEAESESTVVWSHKQRIVLFLSAMRHFREALKKNGVRLHYTELGERKKAGPASRTLSALLATDLKRFQPEKVMVVEPGEWRVREGLVNTCRKANCPLEIRTDGHFMATLERFDKHAEGRKTLRLEYYYRELRREYGILLDGDQPAGGAWNFDKENRKSYGRKGPENLSPLPRFRPDALTREVIALVEMTFPDHPGSLENFNWPVTRRQAKRALAAFMEHRLPGFGDHQDAMWSDEPFLNHSLLSSSLNLKLLDPREVVSAAETAYREGLAPLPAVEGFIRQILGWREYVRGIYWRFMPEYIDLNALGATEPLPDFFWTGKTSMNCLRQTIDQTLKHGYAHHIQRLMVTGLYALLLGVHPKEVHEWYLAIYVDAVEWVELPNTLGMSQHADGGIMASKPYCASGQYIKRMSNYCQGCRFNPAEKTGETACPFTTLYWDFLLQHEERFASNQRMSMVLRNLGRLDAEARRKIQAQAAQIRKNPAMV